MARIDRDDADLPVIDADARSLSARPVVVGRGPAARLRARSIGIALSALLVLTGGVAVGGLLQPVPSPSPSEAAPSPPEQTSAAACHTATTEALPEFDLVIAGTDTRAQAEDMGYANRGGQITPGEGWLVPGGIGARALPVESGSGIEIASEGGECIRHVLAEYALAIGGRDPTPDDRYRLEVGAVLPPAGRTPLGTLPDGDWVVRVLAYFETGISGPPGQLVSEQFYRVQVGPGPFGPPPITPGPDSTPRVTPAVPCGPAPASADDVTVIMTRPDGDAVAGAELEAERPIVAARGGDTLALATLAARCAVAWEIRVVDLRTGANRNVGRERNVSRDPAFAAQNNWTIEVLPGDQEVRVELTFADGLTVSRGWLVKAGAFEVPDVALVAAGGPRVAALPGCGLHLELSGYSTFEDCVAIEVPDGLQELAVPAWSIVTIEIPGWEISSWSGECGRVVEMEGTAQFESQFGLGGYAVDPGQQSPGPARFLARPGTCLVQLHLSATRDGDLFAAPFYAAVTGS